MLDPDVFPPRTGPRGAIGALVRCTCGHGIGVHTRAGCHAGTGTPCACRISDSSVLDRAVAQAALELRAAMHPRARRHG
jgi:hypothetical protein